LRSNDSATVLFLPFAGDEALSVYDELSTDHIFDALHNLNLQDWSNPFFFFRYENSFYRLVEIHWTDELLELHSLSNAPSIALTPMADYNLGTVLALSSMILLLVLLKLVLVLNVLALVHADAVAVLELCCI
jgi:hypothetical protein